MEKKDERDSPSLSSSSPPPPLKTDASETSPKKEDQRALPQSSLPPTTDIAAMVSETTPLAVERKSYNGVSPQSPSPRSPPPLTTHVSDSETGLSRLTQSISESPPPPDLVVVPTQNNNSRRPEDAICRRLRDYSKKAYDLMVSMGYQGGGLGRYGQGITKAISPKERKKRYGLGYGPEEPPLSQPSSTRNGSAQVAPTPPKNTGYDELYSLVGCKGLGGLGPSKKGITEALQPKLELTSSRYSAPEPTLTDDEPEEPVHNPFSSSRHNIFLEPAEQSNYWRYVDSLESEQDRLKGFVPPESIEQEMLKLNKQQGEASKQVSQSQATVSKKKQSKSSRRRRNQRRNQNKDEDDLPQ